MRSVANRVLYFKKLSQKILIGLRKAGFGFGGFCVVLFGFEFFGGLL
jgi:hypothetical protein